MYNVLHNYLDFFAEESCGQCTPCRVGCQQLLKGVEKVKKGEAKSTYLNELDETGRYNEDCCKMRSRTISWKCIQIDSWQLQGRDHLLIN